METSFICSISSHVDNDSFLSAESDVEEPLSDIDELEVDSQSEKLSPITINDSFLSTDSDVEPVSGVDGLEHNTESIQCSLKNENKLLPFLNLSRSWYVKEQKIHNTARDALRRANPIERTSGNVILCMNRSQVQGSLEDNLKGLEQKVMCPSTKTLHYKAVCEVGNYILLNGPLVKAQQAGEIYLKSKNLQAKTMSSEYYEIFSKHLNLIQVYIFDVAYLLPNATGKVASFVDTIKGTINTESILHSAITDRIKGIFQQSLQYMDTH